MRLRPPAPLGSRACACACSAPWRSSAATRRPPSPSPCPARALLGYLALAPRALTREHLCTLLWDEAASDPRGELRWCLSRLRALLGAALDTQGKAVRLDVARCQVDALVVGRALQAGLAQRDAAALEALARLFTGDLLEGLEAGRHARFGAWLLAERRRLRAAHAAVLERLAALPEVGADRRLECLARWSQLVPLELRAHAALLRELARAGRIREGDEHLGAATRMLAAQGLDWRPLGVAWRAARGRTGCVPAQPPPGAADAAPGQPPPALAALPPPCGQPHRRASLAVLPFVDLGGGARELPGAASALARGFAHDLITRLAKLRSLSVIAQGSVFSQEVGSLGAGPAAHVLDVDYVATGSVRAGAGRVVVNAELTETQRSRVLWAERFECAGGDALDALDVLGGRIVAALASEVEEAERERAVLKAPDSLDAWEALHRGLAEAYQFDAASNEAARAHFAQAVRLAPQFSRAHAGLSFAHFQNAFQRWTAQPAREVDLAFAAAEKSLAADERDPAAHWAMGRALWLRGRHEAALASLHGAVALSPSFALGHYTLAFVQSQSGDAQAALGAADRARALSPFDPLLFGIFGARAMALVRLGRLGEAAEWAIRAAARPNAHAHILALAAHGLVLAGRAGEAQPYLAALRVRAPHYRADDFFSAFHFDEAAQALYRSATRRLGLR